MKFIPSPQRGVPHALELTRRNLQTLLDKLDDRLSNRALLDPDREIIVKAIEDDQEIIVKGVEDVEHYSDRAPGPVYMPETGEYR